MLTDSLARWCRGIGDTPTADIEVRYRGRTRRVLLKCEWHNPTGSIKDRTAAGLLWSIDRVRRLDPGSVVVESTSGNLGMALARLLPTVGCRLLAIIDPKTPASTVATLEASGADFRMATEPDGRGGYLLTRLRLMAELCERDPGLRRTDQYTNVANPLIHRWTTGPEILAQGGPRLSAVYVAVSTGGTLAGIAAHLRRERPEVRLVAVDLHSSLALGRGLPCDRLIPGIGASRPSSFLTADQYTDVARVTEVEAIATCRVALEDTGIALGGSSGCTVRASLDELPMRPGRDSDGVALCVCPDGGATYADTLYDDGWLMTRGIYDDVKRAVDAFRADGLSLRYERSASWRTTIAATV